MPSPRWRKMLRDAWLHRARTLLAILAIAVAIAGAGTVLARWAIVREVVDAGFAASNPASATLTLDRVDARALDLVGAVPGVGDVEARATVTARARVGGRLVTVLLLAREDFATSSIAILRPEAAAWPPTGGSLVLERSSLEVAQAGVGDTLWIGLGEKMPVPLPITGIVRDVGQAPGWMEHQIYAFVTPATLSALGAGPLDQVVFVTEDRTLDQDAVRTITFTARAALEAAGYRVDDIEVPVPGKHIHADQMNSLLVTQAGFAVLTLILSALLALNLVEAMLAGQVREIGIMKTLGAGAGPLATMYLAFAGAIGLVAAALAIPVATIAGRQYAEFSAGMLNFDASDAAVPTWVVATLLAVGTILPVLAAAAPVGRGARMPVSHALRDVGLEASESGSRVLARVGGLARPLLLSLRNAFRRRLRMLRTLATLSAAGGILMGAFHLKSSIRETMDRTFRTMRYDLTVSVAPAISADSMERLLGAVPGVVSVQAWGGGNAAIATPDGTWGNTFPVSAIPAETRYLEMQPVAGRWLRNGAAREIVIGARLLDVAPESAVGTTVTLRIGSQVSEWTVVGVVPSVLASAFVTREAWAALRGDALLTRAVVSLAGRDLVAQSEARRAIHASLSAAGLRVGSALVMESRASVEDHLLLVADFLSAMGWLILVVGGLGLATTMSLAVLERTREIGVLRAIGARHGAIHLIIQGEGLVVAVLSWLLAIPLSIPMARVLGDAFGRIFFRTPLALAPDPRGVVAWLAVVVMVSLLACAWPAWRATRISARAALAYE